MLKNQIANPDLSIQNTPILDEIFDLLDRLAKTGAENVKPLAREARMVLIARLASSSTSPSQTKSKRSALEESAQETYQGALKLLQDPLLPVRAHGLLLLRQLVSARSAPGGNLELPSIDRALVPGILSIFLQSLQDDDSYIFLNAVQGLSAMVDGFGKETLKEVCAVSASGCGRVGGDIDIAPCRVDGLSAEAQVVDVGAEAGQPLSLIAEPSWLAKGP